MLNDWWDPGFVGSCLPRNDGSGDATEEEKLAYNRIKDVGITTVIWYECEFLLNCLEGLEDGGCLSMDRREALSSNFRRSEDLGVWLHETEVNYENINLGSSPNVEEMNMVLG